MRSKEQKPVKNVHLANLHIAGFGYWDGCEAFEHLRIGTSLNLVREADNPFDPYAVAIYYGDYKLGFIPRGSNHDISKYLDMGLDTSTTSGSPVFLRMFIPRTRLKSSLKSKIRTNQPDTTYTITIKKFFADFYDKGRYN